ncbi:MAG: hypothetical protein K8U57_40790 [Planctomycetes bacterium]|nr:hypothetical protein [Planctomycetota bacterium]
MLLADHLTAEYSKLEGKVGFEFCKWYAYPDKRDNHMLDVLAGNCVAASVSGLCWNVVAAVGDVPKQRETRKAVKFSEIVKQKEGQRPQWMRDKN